MDLFLLQPWFVSHEPHCLNRFVDMTRGGVSLEERFVKDTNRSGKGSLFFYWQLVIVDGFIPSSAMVRVPRTTFSEPLRGHDPRRSFSGRTVREDTNRSGKNQAFKSLLVSVNIFIGEDT